MMNRRFRKSIFLWPAVLVAAAGVLSSCDNKDLEGQPEWLGNSIYERLQEDGHYSTTLQLVEDLDYGEVLRQTGSKTVFVADDDAFAAWFQNNPWGVHSYGQLSMAQKKLLLNSAMVNNAYLVELLSNVEAEPDPLEGRCMRRESALSQYDSVARWLPAQMPLTSFISCSISRIVISK